MTTAVQHLTAAIFDYLYTSDPFPVDSDASTIEEIIAELEITTVSERAGRAMDHEAEDAFERLRTDGGPPFNGAEFAAFCRDFGVEHAMSSPYHPASNGHAESAGVRAAKRLVDAYGYGTRSFYRALLARRNAPAPGRSPR